MTELAIPSDAVLMRVFGKREEAFGNNGGAYFQRCLLHAIRDEGWPARKDVTALDAAFIHERVEALMPWVERIRAGEDRLPGLPSEPVGVAADKDELPF